MFRDDAQAFRAIRLLLGRLGLEGLWTDAGPTKGALLLRDESDAPLSAEKRTLHVSSKGSPLPASSPRTVQRASAEDHCADRTRCPKRMCSPRSFSSSVSCNSSIV